MAKKKANGEGTIRKRDNGTWEGRVSVNGKQRSVYGKTKTEVREKLTALMHEADNGLVVNETDMTVAEWMRSWMELWNNNIKASTRNWYGFIIEHYIIPSIGNVKLKKLSPIKVQSLLNKMKKDGYAEGTVDVVYSVLHKAMRKAVGLKMLAFNPCDEADVPEYENTVKRVHPLLDDEVSRFLSAIKGHHYEYVFYVALLTGLRVMELLSLTWDCIDFKNGTIHVYRQLTDRDHPNDTTFTTLKNKHDRTFIAPPSVMETLKLQKMKQKEERLKCGRASDPTFNPQGFVFTGKKGQRCLYSTIIYGFKQVVASIGIPEVRFHDLRHSFATLSLQNGVDPKTVSQNLGHSTVAFTLDRYADVSKTMQQNSADRLESFIQNL